MKRLVVVILLLCFQLGIDVFPAFAQNIECPHRYVTLINPVRGRELWNDKTTKPLLDQLEGLKKNNLKATWLLQYDAIKDQELSQIFKNNKEHEQGLFLEVSKDLANNSGVVYPYDAAWFLPRAVFLSGYSQSERQRIIDELFNSFKKEYGYFPQSVGAWWIDSYSMNYLTHKYGVKSALIVADQKTTDNYGVWGQWWGYPYFPERSNILVPAKHMQDKQDVVVMQWAQRDFLRAYGNGPTFSNYSLQANDYKEMGESTSYFTNLASKYLSCENPLGQITVGIETGIESTDYIDEYKIQLQELTKLKTVEDVTMSEFYERYKELYPYQVTKVGLGEGDERWELTNTYRKNAYLKDYIQYPSNISFADYYVVDKTDFLDRDLATLSNRKAGQQHPVYLIAILLSFIIFIRVKRFSIWIAATLFIAACYGWLMRSFSDQGWNIYYGPVFENILLVKVILVTLVYLLFLGMSKLPIKKGADMPTFLWVLPLSFGLDAVIQSIRYSYISGKHYLGFFFDYFQFTGIEFTKPLTLSFIQRDFPDLMAVAFLKFDPSRFWNSMFSATIIYPLIHIVIALVITVIYQRLPKKIKPVVRLIFIILFVWHILNILHSDPRAVTAFR